VNQLTDTQCVTLKGVLISWLDAQADLLHNSHGYGMNRKDVIVHAVTMIKVAVILEDVLGFQNAKRDYAPTSEEINKILDSRSSLDFTAHVGEDKLSVVKVNPSLDFTTSTILYLQED